MTKKPVSPPPEVTLTTGESDKRTIAPQNTVRSIVQTRDGYLWLTTFDGLVRFDGVQFKVFNTNTTKKQQPRTIWLV